MMKCAKYLVLSLSLFSVGTAYAHGERNGQRPHQQHARAMRDRVPARYHFRIIPPQMGLQEGGIIQPLESPGVPPSPEPRVQGREAPVFEDTPDEQVVDLDNSSLNIS